jgi:hypothetical protein
MNAGVPHRSREYLKDALVADTSYLLGQPVLQRIDMDLDGRLETVRRFNHSEFPPDALLSKAQEDPLMGLDSSESDWDGDGIYEYGEVYRGNLVIRSWDMDKDGTREYTETGVRDR